MGPVPRAMTLRATGIRLPTFDRPGLGDSDRLPGRSRVYAVSEWPGLAPLPIPTLEA